MGKTYKDTWRGWGEYRKERSRLKDFEDWKTEALEGAQEMSNVFVIINEWGVGDYDLREIVDGNFFYTEDAAWRALREIADAFEAELNLQDTSIDVEPGKNVQYETYYIQELTHG